MAPLIAEGSGDLQLAGRLRYAFPADTHEIGDLFLGDRQIARWLPIQEHEQPAAQLLVDRVVPIARDCLRHLRNIRLCISQKHTQHRAAPFALLL
jgi:hypothetical protein